jgi:hypothetical protein
MPEEKKGKMSDSERSALMKQMDDDLEEHFKKLEEKAKQNEGSITHNLSIFIVPLFTKLLPKSLAFL